MKLLKGISKGIDKVNDVLGNLFSVLVLGILAIILCEVILRRVFNSPQIWTQDLIVMLFASYTILICAYGFQKKAFVAVDVVFAMMPKAAQYALHLVTYLCFLVPFVFWILPKSFNFFLRAYTTNEQTYSVWAAPTWPVKLCFFIGLFLLAVQTVSEMLKQLVCLIEEVQGKKALPDGGKEDQK